MLKTVTPQPLWPFGWAPIRFCASMFSHLQVKAIDGAAVATAHTQLGQMPNIRQKLDFKKTNRTCACNSLTSSEYLVRAMIGNGNYAILLKLEKIVRLHQVS